MVCVSAQLKLVCTDKTGSAEDLLVANPNHAARSEGLISSEDEDNDTPPESASEGDNDDDNAL